MYQTFDGIKNSNTDISFLVGNLVHSVGNKSFPTRPYLVNIHVYVLIL